jgi:hypothetical protein
MSSSTGDAAGWRTVELLGWLSGLPLRLKGAPNVWTAILLKPEWFPRQPIVSLRSPSRASRLIPGRVPGIEIDVRAVW